MWKKETDAQGGPIWRGKDAVLNMDRHNADVNKHASEGCAVAVFIGFLLVLAVLFNNITSAGSRHGANNWPLLIMIAVAALAGIGWLVYVASKPEWLDDGWTLKAEAGGLSYVGERNWAVPVDEIASVEASQTRNWQQTRDYGGTPRMIPEHEWQTFLVLADQSRLVILTANADREGCTTLAASIRAHVEALRAKTAPVAISPAASSAPLGEGFDL